VRILPHPCQHAGAHKRRLAAPGGTSDQQQLLGARGLFTEALKPFHRRSRFLVAAEEDCGILNIKRQQAREDRSLRVPVECIDGIEAVLLEAIGKLSQRTVTIRRDIDLLEGWNDWTAGAGLAPYDEHRFAFLACDGEFGKAPFGGEPIGRQDDEDGLARAESRIDALLPIDARWDTVHRIEVEEEIGMALTF